MAFSSQRRTGSALAFFCAAALAVGALYACVGEDAVLETPRTLPEASVTDAPGDTSAPRADASAPLSFCKTAGPHDFCVDFDGLANLDEARFTVFEVAGGNPKPVLVADAGTPSPTGAMRAALHVGTSADGYHSARGSLQDVYAVGPPARARVKIAFDMLVERADETGAPAYVMGLADPAFSFTPTRPDGGADVFVTTVRTYDDAGTAAVEELPAFKVPIGTWTHVSFSVVPRTTDPSGAGATLEVGAHAKTYSLLSSPLPHLLRVDVGLGTSNATGGDWTVAYDNVTIDWK